MNKNMSKFFIRTPFANIISKTIGHSSLETQVLFGETILMNSYQPNQIFACEQTIFLENGNRSYYPGSLNDISTILPIHESYFPTHVVCSTDAYLKTENLPLPFGSFIKSDGEGNITLPDLRTSSCNPKDLRPLSQIFNTETLIQDAYKLVGLPYLWGGRFVSTNHLFSTKSGIDCSGFLNLLYRAQNIRIPRNSSDQFRDSVKVESFEKLPIGGMIFLAENQKDKITHVMLKASDTILIDASMGAGLVRILTKDDNFIFINNTIQLSYKGSKIKSIPAFFGKAREHPYKRVLS